MSAPGAAPTVSRWRTDAFLAAGMVLNYADRSALPVVFPALRGELGLSDVTLGLLGSLFLWSYALCGPVAGMLADRYSRRLIVIVSLAAWSAVTALTGLAHGLVALALLRVALGVSESLFLPSAAAIMAANHGLETRGRAMGVLLLCQSVGVIIGGVGVSYAADHFGWRSGFLFLGFAGIALALAGGPLLPSAPAAATTAAPPPFRVRDAIAYLVHTPTYLTLLAGTVCAGVAVWIFFNWLSLYLVEKFGIKMAEAGFAGVAMLQLSSMVGIAAGAWISDRAVRRDHRSRLVVFAAGYFAAAPFLLCFLLDPGLLTVTVCCALFSLLRALGSVNEMPVLCEVVPPAYRSTAVGILIACACLSGGVGIFVGGLLKRGFGLELVFAGLGGFFALAGAGFLLARRRFLESDLARAEATAG
ncbi:MAG: MFS transporter [Opitutaceae bacterium]|nr:MFS transporter [Opitutaceae bacterium]